MSWAEEREMKSDAEGDFLKDYNCVDRQGEEMTGRMRAPLLVKGTELSARLQAAAADSRLNL